MNSNRTRTLILYLTLAMLMSCREEAVVKKTLRPVKYIVVENGTSMQKRTFSGHTRSAREARLSFRVPGTIKQLPVVVGDQVKPGQVIAILDPTDFQIQVEQAEAGLAQAKAQSRNAAATYERVRELYVNNNVSQNDLDGARAAHESAEAAVNSIEKRLELARQQLSYTTLRAPGSGAIANVTAELNENVGAGRPIALLTTDGNLELEVAIPENLINKIDVGQKVEISFDAKAGKPVHGQVTEVGVAAIGSMTTFPVTIQLSREEPDLRSGMVGAVTFSFAGKTEDAKPVVPHHCVLQDNQGRFVYLMVPESEGVARVKRRSVEVGTLSNKGLSITSGLSAGEFVITAGMSGLEDGMKVKQNGE
ncbi:MAG: hypothetical protein CSA81_04555 [Acidobacteria bacterium]|nr:MAG: hypothetical protein CSA81_04555 [Acidobacteriota bacterium]